MRSYYLLMVFIPASALIVEDVFPPSLAECYSGQVDKNTTPYDVQTSCLERFLGHMYKNTSSIDLGKDAFDWFDSLGRKLHTRLRRQTRYRLRERKEIRTLSQTELINFFDAVNALKNDKSVKPNKYDSFAIMHQGDVGASAHDGPNFVSWHRYFLVLFENALREKNSKVTLPYWDSRADYLMTNKEDSILFTEFFLGNAKGVVYTGPFAFWSTPTNPSTLLRREIGVVGSPVHPERLKTVFTKKYHREILRPSTPDSSYANLESHHDNVHRWVGGNTGQMSSIIFSPMDPVFWLLHCFVDYLWEQFRENQKKLGINSETDYPETTITAHKPNRLMDNLKPPKKNIDGYSNSFTRQIYRHNRQKTYVKGARVLGSILLHVYISHIGRCGQVNENNFVVSTRTEVKIQLHIRLRRQGNHRLRVRKEIRTLRENELDDFFDAVNALKKDKSVSPNKYDSFALMHQGGALASAHDGPNFVSWHRYYLLLFENALREKKSRVTLPYWDSTADFLMANKTDSILFTELFLGNPKGVVYSGPFALWETPTKPTTLLRRDVGAVQRSSPIDPKKLKAVFRKKYHRDILRRTTPRGSYANLESHHDSVHVWVGGSDGHMADANLSPMDPVFYIHHCFIDYLWEKFRKRQKRLGINSETDYPQTTVPEHQPNRRMDNLLPSKKNIEGYSNSFTKQIYRYAPAPTCHNKCGGAIKGFLFCDRSKKGCVSGSRYDFIPNGGLSEVAHYYPPMGKGERMEIPVSFFPSPDQSTPVTGTTQAEEHLPDIKSESISPFESKENKQLTRTSTAPTITKRFKSHFGSRRSRGRRSTEFSETGTNLKFDFSINLHLGQAKKSPFNSDNLAISPIAITNKHDRNRKAELDQIKNKRTFNITFQTDGFSYSGRHLDYISIDERNRSSESIALIAFKKPISGETKAYVRTYDSNGVICQPSCLVSKSTYKECSGLIKITSDFPLMFVDSYNDVVDSEITPFLRLKEVSQKRYHREVLTPTAHRDGDANLTSDHNGAHAWVGGRDGHMGDHLPNRLMDNLRSPKRNIEGYSTAFTKQIYRYAPAPTCRNKCGGASNRFLFCDRTKKACVSILLKGFNQIKKWYPSFTKGQCVYTPSVKDLGAANVSSDLYIGNSVESFVDISKAPVSNGTCFFRIKREKK
ncbi:tyrosinase [Mytilus galloprovincialis]|uniref:Tyrosinase n=1 Tax=Mytilus galloprovincialis TaxID=29158 RepID=A0A8B6HH61_MYTGA|nr:tyrosinase [Mytilus galloprovincialis]